MVTENEKSTAPTKSERRGRRSRQQHGLPTPGGTPAPETGRIVADKERKERESTRVGTMPQIIETPHEGPSAAPSGAPVDDGTQNHQAADGTAPVPTEEQIALVRHVRECNPQDYQKMFGFKPTGNARQDKENLVNLYRRQGSRLHPDFNKAEGAGQAFEIACRTAEVHGVPDDEIDEVRTWDGEELPELRLSDDGKWTEKADAMDGVEIPEPTEAHWRLYQSATPWLARLAHNPADEVAIDHVTKVNDKIGAINKEQGLEEQSFKIDLSTFIGLVKGAAPIVLQLQTNPADERAWAEADRINAQLADFNRLHGYPAEWKINFHAERASVPAVTTSSTSSDNVSTSTTSSSVQVGPITFRRSTHKEGYVKEHGVEKKIEGAQKVGAGHQMLISRPGMHNLRIYELVAASTFGKGFGAAYLNRPDAKIINKGKKEDLNNMKIEHMVIAGVATTRRDPSRVSKGGWVREPNTIVLVGFGEQPGQFIWYDRSILGAQFGPNRVDEDIRDFRLDAGQEEPTAVQIRGSHTPHNLHRGDGKGPEPSTSTGMSFGSQAGTANDEVTSLMAKLQELSSRFEEMSRLSRRR